MTKEEILMWNKNYDQEEDLYTTGLEEKLRKKFQKNKFVIKDDLREILRWKFQGQLKGRGEYKVKKLEKEDALKIRKLSEQALKIHDDRERIKLLAQIREVGPAIASVILTFYDPQNYGVFDIHVWRELFGEEPKDLFNKNKDYYLRVLNELRKLAKKHNLSARMIEKALFEKNKVESKNMKKKHKSNSLESLMKKAKPVLCPKCNGKVFLLNISCGLLPCRFRYICPKCPREIVITAKDGIVENKKLTKEELIKRLNREEL